MNRFAVLALRVLLVLLVLGLLFCQVVIIPIASVETAADLGLPEIGLPYTVAWIALVVCVEVVLGAIWVLLSMVRRDAIFTSRAFTGVNVIIGAGVVATALLAGIALHQYLVVVEILDAPGLVVLAGTGVLGAAAFVALMIVMRGLLHAATALRGELDEVV